MISYVCMQVETSFSSSPKVKSTWHCQECGYESSGYLGRCSHCGAWSSFIKKKLVSAKTAERSRKPKHGIFLSPETEVMTLDQIPDTQQKRLASNSAEFNQVLGGGVVAGSITLIGGEPGIGKSTLLLQFASGFAATTRVLYASAEESSEQIKIRARRLGLLRHPEREACHPERSEGSLDVIASPKGEAIPGGSPRGFAARDDGTINNLLISTENNLENLLEQVREKQPGLIIIDSIQTIYLPELDSIPGSPTQIRECAANLMRFAKSSGIPIFLVGHINKDGDLAGPKILEHMVDTVLQFEGERDVSIRILRSAKNRFGSTDEVALFTMSETGLQDLSNPSQLFLSERAGGVVFASKEGKRSLLLEIQALVLGSEYSNPRRVANGIELARLQQILAILEKRLSLSLTKTDVYCNVAGGMSVREPAADLAIALAIITSANDQLAARFQDTVALGELGLTGELRSISNLEARVREAAKLGFKRVLCPMQDKGELSKYATKYKIAVEAVKNIAEILHS